MIWYLLYPLRGTTDPPRLPHDHPLRRAFYRHGKLIAHHWLATMMLSAAIATGCSYPTVFLSGSPTTGLASYPHPVWTTAKHLDPSPDRTDVEMRQVWIYGSHMQALTKETLKSALILQQTLIGHEGVPLPASPLDDESMTWGIHSPLMYWNNSASAIDGDDDLLRTINDRSRDLSSLNVALRPASVLAGKRFDRWKLQAADALVITLINKVENGAGGDWESRMASLSIEACKNCTLFPQNGPYQHLIYEFSFMPLNWNEHLLLGFAYSCMALYVGASLRRLRAFHSRFGLVVTAITQMSFSILSSITVCGILKTNLSMVPLNAFPFVVLVIGLENMFRVINATLAYPATMATDQRIANALGDVGPVSVATVVQNLIILATLSQLVSTGIAAFCFFAFMATLFDTFFLLTFFVAVLSVDISRLELQDAISRSNPAGARRSSPSQPTWFAALLDGRLPWSTRMAGTAVTTTFILSLNYHFFEPHEKAGGSRYLLSLKSSPSSVASFDAFTPPPMNATLSPGEWLHMQDFGTAREIMRLAKPGDHSMVMRVFAPVIVVLSGADRTGTPSATETWTHALRTFTVHHFYPVAVAIVFAVAFVTVLMNFLLYSEAADDRRDRKSEQSEETLAVQTLAMPHTLDIIRLFGTDRGHFITIGLDRTVGISIFDRLKQSRQTLALSPEALSMIRWPIHGAVLDENAEWMACYCADERVLIYNCAKGAFIETIRYPDDHPPVLFQFTRLLCGEIMRTQMLLLTSGGRLMMSDPEALRHELVALSQVPLLGATVIEVSSQSRRLVMATEAARIIAFRWTGCKWAETSSQSLGTTHGRLTGRISIQSRCELGPEILTINTLSAVFFIDGLTLSTIAKLDLDRDQDPQGPFLLGQIAHCSCGSVAFLSLAVNNDASSSRDCEMAIWTALNADGEEAPICLRNSATSCVSFDGLRKETRQLTNAGTWNALASHAVLGFRERQSPAANATKAKSSPLRLRHRQHSRMTSQKSDKREWEAYRLAIDGEVETIDGTRLTDQDHPLNMTLYVNTAGPIVPLDSRSVVVAFGNSVKILRASRGERQCHRTSSLERKASSSRRRGSLRKAP